MGLLDDAIREHLDLKRARGGDPAEIERMEREALGPVRREPTRGSARPEAAEGIAQMEAEHGYPDDRDQLLGVGYHDSTAPHPHPHHEHPHQEHADPHFAHLDDDPFAAPPEEVEQPKRRFLRRNRAASPSESALPDVGFHEGPAIDPYELHEPLGHEHAPLEHGAPLDYHEPLEHHDYHEPLGHDPHDQAAAADEPPPHDAPAHHESLAHHDLHERDEHPTPETESTPPPHLQFDHPPKRPRFSAEPPAPSQSQPPTEHEAQETTEFDVQRHIAETRFEPDPEPRPQASRPAAPDAPAGEEAPEDEDVLEETPEFLQDTPEHDRLWFEQRPPRDFDFDG